MLADRSRADLLHPLVMGDHGFGSLLAKKRRDRDALLVSFRGIVSGAFCSIVRFAVR
jgi:hypothetical protein